MASGDGSDWGSSSGCENQGSYDAEAAGLSYGQHGSMVRARLRAAQSGLGRAERWLVQAVAVATVAAKVTQGFAMGGRK